MRYPVQVRAQADAPGEARPVQGMEEKEKEMNTRVWLERYSNNGFHWQRDGGRVVCVLGWACVRS